MIVHASRRTRPSIRGIRPTPAVWRLRSSLGGTPTGRAWNRRKNKLRHRDLWPVIIHSV